MSGTPVAVTVRREFAAFLPTLLFLFTTLDAHKQVKLCRSVDRICRRLYHYRCRIFPLISAAGLYTSISTTTDPSTFSVGNSAVVVVSEHIG